MTKFTLVRFLLGAVLAVLVLSSVPQAQAQVCPPPCGCCCGFTPGYWKNHLEAWGPTGYSPYQSIQSVFGSNAPAGTLLDALNFQGGPGIAGAQQILLRAAVASLLNAKGTTTFTCLTYCQVISMVQTALGSGSRDTILALATLLDGYNQDCVTTIIS